MKSSLRVVTHAEKGLLTGMLACAALIAVPTMAEPVLPAGIGEPADLAGSAYQYRADRPADQNAPESWLLLMLRAGQSMTQPADTRAPAVQRVLAALLWEEARPIRAIELHWPENRVPSPGEVSVVCLDTSVRGIHTWWNRQAPGRSAELRATRGSVFFYTVPVDTFGIVVSREKDEASLPVPQVRAFGADVWKHAEVVVEWGFDAATADRDYGGELEAYDGVIMNLRPLEGDAGTSVAGRLQWRCGSQPRTRRGISFDLLYIGTSRRQPVWPTDGRPEDIARTIVTVKTHAGTFSFLASDLEHGPILAPEYGFFVSARMGNGAPAVSARDFIARRTAEQPRTVRQRVREMPEQTWEGAVGAMWQGKELPPTPKPEFLPAMQVEVPDARLQAQWNLGAWHLLRRARKNDAGHWRFNDYPFAILASENYLIFRALDLMGMHQPVTQGFEQWLEMPVDLPPPTGLFSDGRGVLSHARNDVPGAGANHFKTDLGGGMDSVHAMGPGAIGYQMVEHYRLTGDEAWFRSVAPRLIANADWILRQRRLLASIVPGGERLWGKGLQPAHQVTPDSGGMLMQFYESEAYYWLAVRNLGEALAGVDPEQSRRLAAEAAEYRKDILAAVELSIARTPVVPVRDGTYHSFIPFACYVRGFASGAWNWRRPGSVNHVNGLYWDTVQSAGPLISPAGLLATEDPRVQGFLDVLEDRLLCENDRLAVRTPGYDPERDFFSHAGWQYQCGLERHANIHFAADDVPCFIRSMLNQYAVDIQPGDYTLQEHTVHGPVDKSFEESAFLERFRNMLVAEEGEALWLARATPRTWLEQGKRIAMKDAPTHFGTVSYEIVSSMDRGAVEARISLPDRSPPGQIVLRLRHPQRKAIQSLTINGTPSNGFDAGRETIQIRGLKGEVSVVARY